MRCLNVSMALMTGLATVLAAAPPEFRDRTQLRPESLDIGDDTARRGTDTTALRDTPQDNLSVTSDFDRRDLSLDLGIRADPRMKIGSGRLGLSILDSSLTTNLDLPFADDGFAPEDAHLRIGPLYLRVPEAEFRLLASDNATLTEDKEESGAISILEIPLELSLQVNEQRRFGVDGRVILLPFEGEAGLAGFGGRYGLTGDEDSENFFLADFRQPFTLGGWEMTLYDRFDVTGYELLPRIQGRAQAELDQLNQGALNAVDSVGRYSYGGDFRRDPEEFDSFLDRLEDDRGIVATNVLSLSGTTVTGNHVRLNLFASRLDRWYQDETDEADNPVEWQETVGTSTTSERPQARFRPFASYTASRTNLDDEEIRHVARAGVFGPLTDNIEFFGDAGYTIGPDDDDVLWRLQLTHTPKPSTWHQIEWSREVRQLDNDVETILAYRLHQVLGPRLSGSLTANRSEYDQDGVDQIENVIGASLSYDVGPRTDLRFDLLQSWEETETGEDTEQTTATLDIDYVLGPRADLRFTGEYQRDREIDRGGEANVWTAEIEFTWDIRDYSTLEFTYTYTNYDSTIDAGRRYEENLALVTYRHTF